MAKKDISRTFSELESEDFSLETSVPTDLSLSPDEMSEMGGGNDRRKRISKQLLERKQLQHDLQLVKIELSQKNLMLDNLKADSMQKIEELEERLSNELHKNQILQARQESQMKIQQEDSKTRQQQIQQELDKILQRQHQLEATNARLQERAVDIRNSLENLELTDDQYRNIRNREPEDLSLKDFVALKLYETLKPWKIECADLKHRVKSQGDELYKVKGKLEKTQDALQDEKIKNEDVSSKYQKLTLSYADVKSQVQSGDFKVQNYDGVKSERDDFEAELSELRKKHGFVEATLQTVERERDDLRSQLLSNKQTIELLQKDKDYFSKQVTDTLNKLELAEQRVVNLNDQIERFNRAREEMYDKYVESRDRYKLEYEAKLREELERIRLSNSTEMDRIKSSTKEMYEKENRNLRDEVEMARSERDRAVATEKDTLGKYEQLMQDFHNLKHTRDNEISDLAMEVKVKATEKEQVTLFYDETVRKMKESQLENEKLEKKLKVVTKEFYSLQASSDRRAAEMESALNERNVRLETYEKLERELDDVVMQAADVEDEEEAERVLFSYGYGANVPTTAKRRLKQSVHLARRVLQLERANVGMRKEIEREQTKNRQLGEEVKSANKLLDQSQQPYHYLVESVRVRDAQIAQQRDQLAAMEEDVTRLEKERVTLAKAKNQMAEDLEKLLHHKEEMSVMKQVVLNLSQRRNMVPAEKGPRTPKSPKASRALKPKKKPSSQPNVVMFNEEDSHLPPPTEFTVQHPPDWYKRMQSKAKMNKSKYPGAVQ